MSKPDTTATARRVPAGATLTVRLVKSTIGRQKSHRACVRGLGLLRLGHTVQVADTPENRGMIRKVSYLLSVV